MLTRCIILVFFAAISGEGIAQAPNAAEIKNNKIKKITSRHKVKGETDAFVASHFYNENGDDTAYYENDIRKYYLVVGYNRKLQPLTIAKFFPDGTAMDKTVFTYKPDGSSVSVNTDAQFGLKVTDTYDKKGHLMSETIPDGTVFKYVYNAKGQLTSTYSIPAQGDKKFTVSYSYNSKGKLIASTKKRDYSLKTVYEYDPKGLLKKQTLTSTGESGEKNMSTVEYEYGY